MCSGMLAGAVAFKKDKTGVSKLCLISIGILVGKLTIALQCNSVVHSGKFSAADKE